jgi:predicted lactoylglutathione lyase
MERMIFINLPVTDLARSVAFYEQVGAVRDERFCDASCAMVKFSDAICVMLLTYARFASFTDRPIADRSTTEVLLCLSAESRAQCDALTETAVAAGGKADPCAPQDHGFMYGRSFEDPDGHIWELAWMDVDAAMQAATQAVAA